MKISPELALTYDDVLLVPQYSEVESRRKLSTRTKLTKKISLQIPVVSANMDTVTESEMAIAMAREGGIGIIHRFMSLDEQSQQIARVKKAESFVVADPLTLSVEGTVGDARRIIESWRVSYNTARPHRGLGSLTPKQYAEKYEEENSERLSA